MKNKIRINFLLFFIFPLLFSMCSPPNFYMIEKMPPKNLAFGSSGGISGIAVEYCLLENGQILEKKRTIYEQIKRIKKAEAQNFFQQMELIKNELSEEVSEQHLFLILRQPNHPDQILKWNKRGNAISENIKKLYQDLIELTKK